MTTNIAEVVPSPVPVAPHPAPTQAVAYSTDDLARLKSTFEENGYVILRNVVPRDRVTELANQIMEAFEGAKRGGSLFAGGGGISGHLNCTPGEVSRWVYEHLKDAGVIDVVKAVFPKTQGMPNVGCNLNLPYSVAQHYHADGLYLGDFVVTNVALVDTDLDNGAIDVLPGTHKKFYKYWRFALERAHRLSRRLPMQRGDVLIRTSNLWHRGMPNNTPNARPMLTLRWDNEKNPPDYDPFKEGGGKVTFQPNWYKPNLLGRIRERTFVTAPITYSAYRFVTSLVGNKGYASW